MVGYFEKQTISDVIVERIHLEKITIIESKVFWERLQRDIIQGHRKIIADLSDCKIVDSALIGVLVQAQKKLTKNHGNLKLVMPKKDKADLISYFAVSEFINVYEFLDEAVNSFNSIKEVEIIPVA